MNYNVYTTPDFKRIVKKLLKKYPSLKADLQELVKILSINPATGIHLGHGIFKIRMAITSKSKGKSAGARVITYFVSKDNEIYMVFMYDKSELENISIEQILELLTRAGLVKY